VHFEERLCPIHDLSTTDDNGSVHGKPKLPFLVQDPIRLDRELYSSYDERFLDRKVSLLWATLQDNALLERFVETEFGPDEAERMRHGTAAEILFAEFHQFESFFAMLLAPFQPLPHWIYLNTYPTSEIKSKARQFMDRQFSSLSGGLTRDRNHFLRLAVYAGLVNKPEEEQTWNLSFENLWWLIHRMAEKYLKADEYNSYKHGLRMMSSTATLAIASDSADFSNPFMMRSANSITHLVFQKHDMGTHVLVQTKGFNPEESVAHVSLMASLLANIKRVRLAGIEGTEVEVQLYTTLDKQRLQELAVCQNWGFRA
jgi:hypothetical protein